MRRQSFPGGQEVFIAFAAHPSAATQTNTNAIKIRFVFLPFLSGILII